MRSRPKLKTYTALESSQLEFEQVLKTYGDSLWRFTLMYEQEYNRRKDLYQEILVAIWKALPNFEQKSSIKTYVFRIAHNRGITFRNRSARSDIFSTLNFEPGSENIGPQELLIKEEEQDNLKKAVLELSPSLRQVVLLILEGLSNKEISDVLGISENNVAVRLLRAKEILSGILES